MGSGISNIPENTLPPAAPYCGKPLNMTWWYIS